MSAAPTLESLARAPKAELEARIAAGSPIDLAAMCGHEYRGINCHAPRFFLREVRQFKKVFVDDSGARHGWNLKIRQDPELRCWEPDLTETHRSLRDDPVAAALWWLGGWRGKSPVLGHFALYPAPPGDPWTPSPNAVVIDYHAAATPWGDVTVLMRDYVVAVRPGDPELLVGCAFADFGRFALRLPGIFVMQRDRPLGARS